MNSEEKIRRDKLIHLLLDPGALDADRDDAAMDLGDEYDDDLVLNALLQIARDHNEIEMILSSCGESIGRIWVKRNHFDEKNYKSLAKVAQDGVYFIIRDTQPIWLEMFHIKSK